MNLGKIRKSLLWLRPGIVPQLGEVTTLQAQTWRSHHNL